MSDAIEQLNALMWRIGEQPEIITAKAEIARLQSVLDAAGDLGHEPDCRCRVCDAIRAYDGEVKHE